MDPIAQEIRIKGRNIHVPSIQLDDCRVIAVGRALRIASIFDEELVERRALPDPLRLIREVRSSPLRADVLTFAQRPFGSSEVYDHPMEWDNWAVLRTTSFKDWWENRLPQEVRKNVRLAAKRGVVVKRVPFDEELVRGIKTIFDESPVRQGRKFWHYGKSLEDVQKENGTYLERSEFIGAYFQEKLIGFIKYVRVDDIAILIQFLALTEHREKKPINAILKQTVELCEQTGISHFIYGKYSYGRNRFNSLAEFKRRNGFEEIRFPRYYIPLTARGRIAVSTGLHLGLKNMIPDPVYALLVSARSKLLQARAFCISEKPTS